VAYMVYIRNTYQVWAGKTERKKEYCLNDLDIDKRVILKWI